MPSSAVDDALMTLLAGDGTLQVTLPDGVFFELGGQGATRFVLISLLAHHDTDVQGGRAFETSLYLVKAVTQEPAAVDVLIGEARIDALLQWDRAVDGTLRAAPITPSGYVLMHSKRKERLRLTEVDVATNASWQHAGGHYEVAVAPVLSL
jgi:hypothetical protein